MSDDQELERHLHGLEEQLMRPGTRRRGHSMWKHVTLLVATVLAFGVSMLMMQRAVGLASPWMALMAVFCFLGLAKVADPIYALKVPASGRELRPWESRGAVYRKLGVPGFGALLRNTPLRVLNTTVYVSGN